MLFWCFGREKKKDANMYYYTSCKKDFNCLYKHIHSEEHIKNHSKNIPKEEILISKKYAEPIVK